MTLTLVHAALAVAQTVLSPSWETTKGVMLTLTTGGVLWIARTVFETRDELRDLKHHVVGVDGANGIKSAVELLQRRVGAIENRNIALDAVQEADRQMHPGPDRRHESRRLRDQVHELHDSEEHHVHRREDDPR